MKNFFKMCIVLLAVSGKMYSQNGLGVKQLDLNSPGLVGKTRLTPSDNLVTFLAESGSSHLQNESHATGIEKLTSNNSVRIYPNASGMITISCDSGIKSACTLIIKNALGQLVYLDPIKETSGSFKREVDLGFAPRGAYFVEVESNYERTSKTVILH